MLRKHFHWVVFGLCLGSACFSYAGEQIDGNFNFLYGQKTLSNSDWEPVEEHDLYGVMLDLGPKNSSVHYSIDYFKSESDTESISVRYFPEFPPSVFTVKAETQELALGYRGYPNVSPILKPYLGIGFSVFNAKVKTTLGSLGGSGSGPGVWAGFGLLLRPTKAINLGINLRYSYGKVDFGDSQKINVGGLGIGLVAGTYF